jgi:hypothetical protein
MPMADRVQSHASAVADSCHRFTPRERSGVVSSLGFVPGLGAGVDRVMAKPPGDGYKAQTPEQGMDEVSESGGDSKHDQQTDQVE